MPDETSGVSREAETGPIPVLVTTTRPQPRELVRVTPEGDVVFRDPLTREEMAALATSGDPSMSIVLLALSEIARVRRDVETRLGVTAAALERIAQLASGGVRSGATLNQIARVANGAIAEASKS